MINLKEERMKKELSQSQLAEQCGVFRTNISNIEHGVTKPSIKLAKKIAKILGFDWTEFFDED